ncbi:hypothetical protein Zm00014a_014273 [Zea mays]|uniref:Uncharacterized protein n=1 Tax=Zea mays TaxID=4577 RepID=A0A3L6DLN0_MAIZE|nr:hypothetical protein Zm00014a_014273 [Zea mays]
MGVASRRKSNSAVVSVLELEGKEKDRNQEADVLNNCHAVGAGLGDPGMGGARGAGGGVCLGLGGSGAMVEMGLAAGKRVGAASYQAC